MTIEGLAVQVTPPVALTSLTTDRIVRHYLHAKRIVIEYGFATEIHWQRSRRVQDITDVDFLRETAWVILSSGMRESVIRGLFPQLTDALHKWHPHMVLADTRARTRALQIFHHERKIEAIFVGARIAHRLSTESLRDALLHEPSALLSSLPYVGPVTIRHLAKNLGVTMAKPDRHLARLAAKAGRADAEELCKEISDWVGDSIPVVDIVLWRWATLHKTMCRDSRCDGLPHPRD
jgi:hypothetical protein